jgi:predicted RNA-binding protein with RPS1 domain
LSSSDLTNQDCPTDAQEGTVENPPTTTSLSDATTQNGQPSDAEASRRQILIGSQRDPAAYRARQRRDWTPVDADKPKTPAKPKAEQAGPVASTPRGNGVGDEAKAQDRKSESAVSNAASAPKSNAIELASQLVAAVGMPQSPLPRPSAREKLSPELEEELNRAMGEESMDDLLGGGPSSEGNAFEPDSTQKGRVVAIRRDDVFVEFSGREQGIISLQLFDKPPEIGAEVQVVVQRLNADDGLYELSMPNKAVQIEDWSDLAEGMLVNAQVTGHNTGGLECEVNHIRGFIPVSQIALFRVEDLAQFVGQQFTCLITEANPDRRNLVLSRRAVLEREREESRQQMLSTLQPGQIHDGVVRKLMDFGAFVDLGGVDGLLHISQLAWGRVKHPSDVLHEGQQIKVRVERVDPETGKISLAYRDLQDSPWTAASQKFLPNTVFKGTVTKLMDFGAFVELEPGIEGLVHISELSHKRVFRCSDVVKEGQQVEVMVLSVNTEAKRMSLSMKELSAPPEPEKKEEEPAEAATTKKKPQKPTGPLIGGIGKRTGDRFGLKW